MALFCCCTTVRDLFVEIAFCFSFCVDRYGWLYSVVFTYRVLD